MSRRVRLLLAAVVAGVATLLPVAGTGAGPDAKAALRCVDPLDAAAIDAVLADGGSPLAGQGTTFVSAASAVGIDPRALVAIGAHESVLLTYGPAAVIHNPFGIGPNRVYPDDGTAIRAAAELLATHYLGEGRLTIAAISGKWAPIGASNDPTNLNANWTGGVGALYARLGGNPQEPITLQAQIDSTCGSTVTDTVAAPQDPLVPAARPDPRAVMWDGLAPRPVGPGMAGGQDPVTGEVATIDRFAFPVIPGDGPVTVANTFAEPAMPGAPACYELPARCTSELRGTAGLTVVSAVDGVLRAASADDQMRGIAFWIETGGRDRIGYSGLATYAPSIADRTAVSAGQPLGVASTFLVVAWERDGYPVNAAPLLAATRNSLT